MQDTDVVNSLASYAMRPEQSRGRRHPEPTHPYRGPFHRDRDRIIHSRAFRRLEAKTQVFTRRFSDHFRDRLTHTLEVAQISRTVALALGLNENLCEALALVHDIGHPPFGHAGEDCLDKLMREHGESFDHNIHALRTVEHFENRYAAFRGLNLTFEVREGIIKHSRDYEPDQWPHLSEYCLDQLPPLEAQLIDLADEIAYNAADLDDGRESRLLTVEMMIESVPLFRDLYQDACLKYPGAGEKLQFNEALRGLINRMTTDLIENTKEEIKEAGIGSVEDVRSHSARLVGFAPKLADERKTLRKFLYTELYQHRKIKEERNAAVVYLEELFRHFTARPDDLPPAYVEQARAKSAPRVVCDYLAGMTDPFVFRRHKELLG